MLIWLRAQARSLCLFKYKLYNFKHSNSHSISEKILTLIVKNDKIKNDNERWKVEC